MIRHSPLLVLLLASALPFTHAMAEGSATVSGTLGTLALNDVSAGDPVEVTGAAIPPPPGQALPAPPVATPFAISRSGDAAPAAAPVSIPAPIAAAGPLTPRPDGIPDAMPAMPVTPVSEVTPPVPKAKPVHIAAAASGFTAPPKVAPLETGAAEKLAAATPPVAAGPALSPPDMSSSEMPSPDKVPPLMTATPDTTPIAMAAAQQIAMPTPIIPAEPAATPLPPAGMMAGASTPSSFTIPSSLPMDESPAGHAPITVQAMTVAGLDRPPVDGSPVAGLPVAGTQVAFADESGTVARPHHRHHMTAWEEEAAEEDLPVGTVVGAHHRNDAVANIERIESGGAADEADDVADAEPVVAAPCRPYTRGVTGGIATGTACQGADGIWRIAAEEKRPGAPRPLITASLAP